MSRPVNEPQVPSTSPHLRDTSTTPIDSAQTATHATSQTAPRHVRLNSRPTSENTPINGVSLSQGYPLHEFHSLLEAAQRIANSAPFDTDGHRWREDDQPEPIIHLNRRRLGELSQRPVPSRRYSGRPHVPGEDSGSEGEGYDDEMDSGINIRREHRDDNNPWLPSDRMQGVLESHTGMNSPPAPGDANSDAIRTRSDQGRTRDRQQEEDEEQDLLEQALARSRAARSRFEADNQRTSLSDSQRTRYSTTGSLPTSQSFYDWAPEPSNTTDPSPSIFRSRSRATAGIRRWRPAERLQDYASNHARRDSGNGTSAPQASVNDHNPPFADHELTATPSRVADTSLGSHEDVVDRVERALQQYRIARRALRPLNVDVAFEAVPSPDTSQSVFPRASGNRPRDNNPASFNNPSIAQNAPESLDSTDDPTLSGRGELSGFGSRDYTTPLTTLRLAPTGLQRREDPLRQRIREQIRERRRRGAQQALESGVGREPPLARGPLFENAATPQFAAPSDARRMIEQVRQTHVREQSAEFRRAKGALQYLARLRDADVDEVKAWTIAAELGLHNKGLEEETDRNLAWSVESLPSPSFSSWLEPGTTWTGIQDANDTGEKPTRVFGTHHDAMVAREQRERVDLASRQHESFRTRMGFARDPLERTILGDGANDPVGVARNSMQVLEDAERSLSSMLERSEELLRENDRQLQDNDEQLRQSRERLRDTDRRLTLLDEAVRRRAEARARQIAILSGLPQSQTATSPDSDWWNVKVVLHSVDEKQMTVSGTMTASHKLNRPSYSVASGADDTTNSDDPSDTSMDSFFTGEIIDFVHHGLDTLPLSNQSRDSSNSTNARYRRQQDEWKVGGPETDLSYWAGIGPFKQEIDRAIKAKESQNDVSRAMQTDETHPDKQATNGSAAGTAVQVSDMSMDSTDKQRSISEPPENSLLTPLSEEEKCAVKMNTMADLLCNTKWMNEHIGAQGWILMRWKERCFVAPGTEPNPDVRRPWISSQPRESSQSMNTPGDDASSWNVNDLIAHHRLRRRRERDARVWSTNAAEREELAATNGPSTSQATTTEPGTRPAAWGLTISGFYYVALERKTGRIEALYYDCGSTPFQRLKMNPETLYRVPQRDEDVSMSTSATAENGGDDKPDFSGIAGLKTSFSVVEFR